MYPMGIDNLVVTVLLLYVAKSLYIIQWFSQEGVILSYDRENENTKGTPAILGAFLGHETFGAKSRTVQGR